MAKPAYKSKGSFQEWIKHAIVQIMKRNVEAPKIWLKYTFVERDPSDGSKTYTVEYDFQPNQYKVFFFNEVIKLEAREKKEEDEAERIRDIIKELRTYCIQADVVNDKIIPRPYERPF